MIHPDSQDHQDLQGRELEPSNRSPLTEPGVDAKVGDFILAINGKSTKEVANPMTLLINTVGKQVKLTLSSKPEGEGARQVTVVPIANEASLYYLDWVNKNIETVNKATKGEVGYLHIPDMLSDGLNEFAKRFYPQLRKKALIIDVRGNVVVTFRRSSLNDCVAKLRWFRSLATRNHN